MEADSASASQHEETNTLRSVLLQDMTGRIQALLPDDAMLDLRAIHEETGRELKAVNPNDQDKLYANQRLSRLKACPVLNHCTALIDQGAVDDELKITYMQEDAEIEIHQVPLVSLRDALLEHEHDLLEMRIAVPSKQLQSEVPGPGAGSEEEKIVASVKNFTSLRIKQRLEDTLEIPTLPQTAQRIIQLRADPNALVSDLAEIVESDPSLAAQVVSWAASPYYAVPGKIRSVQDAIVRVLGFDLVGNLALGLALGKTLAMPKDKVDGITPYWHQSIYCSTLVEAIVKLIPPELKPGKGLLYLSGLLHNFGYMVMAHIFPPHFSQICRYMEANPKISHMAIENHLLQITREQVCGWLMRLWNMPEEVGIAIQYQHDPYYAGKHSAYPNLIFMALRLLRQHGIGDAPAEEIPEFLYERFELDRDEVDRVVAKVLESKDEIVAIANNFPS